ncbi:uncharacterized protein YbjT (DUF2867 family) [Bradyrhizobium sp. LB9.1b]
MQIIIFGATGMVGQGVLRECLVDAGIDRVVAIGRSPTGVHNAKLTEITHGDFTDYSAIETQLTGFDACFFCLGVSSIGMSEDRYRHLTYDLTLAAATTLARLNPQMIFTYVTGAGTDSTEQGSRMWARIKGKTENDLLKLPFKAAYMFRPGAIQPLHGARSKTSVGAGGVYRNLATLVGAAPALAAARHLDRADGPRHDPGCPGGVSAQGAGDGGYQ